MLVFSTLISSSTLPTPRMDNYTVNTYTVCKGGGRYEVLSLRQINTCRKVPLKVNFLDDDILHCLLWVAQRNIIIKLSLATCCSISIFIKFFFFDIWICRGLSTMIVQFVILLWRSFIYVKILEWNVNKSPKFRFFKKILQLGFKGIDRSFELRGESRLIWSVLANWRLGNFLKYILKGHHHKISKKPLDAA